MLHFGRRALGQLSGPQQHSPLPRQFVPGFQAPARRPDHQPGAKHIRGTRGGASTGQGACLRTVLLWALAHCSNSRPWGAAAGYERAPASLRLQESPYMVPTVLCSILEQSRCVSSMLRNLNNHAHAVVCMLQTPACMLFVVTGCLLLIVATIIFAPCLLTSELHTRWAYLLPDPEPGC